MFQCCRILNTRHIPYIYIYSKYCPNIQKSVMTEKRFFSFGSGLDPRQWNITYLGPFWCSCCWMLLICTLTSLLIYMLWYVMVAVQCIDHILQSWVKLMMPWMPWTKIRSEIEDEPSKLYSKLDQEAPSSAEIMRLSDASQLWSPPNLFDFSTMIFWRRVWHLQVQIPLPNGPA